MKNIPIWLRAIGIFLVIFGIIALFIVTVGGLFDVESQSDMMKSENWLPVVISILVIMIGTYLSGRDTYQAKRWFLTSICWGVSILLFVFGTGFALEDSALFIVFVALAFLLFILGLLILLLGANTRELIKKVFRDNKLEPTKDETNYQDTGLCPFCGSSNIDEGLMYNWQRICKDCRNEWNITHK